MIAGVTISDMKGNEGESRHRSYEFDSYNELNDFVIQFDKETGFRKTEIQIEALDDDCDQEILDQIAEGEFSE